MLRNLRSAVVVLLITLGLIAQGMGTPAMAASGAGVAKDDCQLMQSQCPGSGMDQHLGMQTCQVPCIPPSVVPRPNVVAVPVVWTGHTYVARTSGVPPGQTPVPDPFPPRSVTLA